MARKAHLLGERFNRLVVVEAMPFRSGHYHWRCRCDCGGETVATTANLRRGNTNSCGCYRAEQTSKARRKHGESWAGGKTPEYAAWQAMKKRCNALNNPRFMDWGGRGIRVCEKWEKDFLAFLSDMGRRPSDQHSLDRINNDGNYEPGNCRWATVKEQARNRRVPIRKPRFDLTGALRPECL